MGGSVEYTPSRAEMELSDLICQEAETRKVSIEVIQKIVADYFGLRLTDLTGPKRPKNIAEPRMIAMYLSRKMTTHSLPEIGNYFGGRTHATVIHVVDQVETTLEKDDRLKQTVDTIKRQMYNQ